MHVQRNRCDYNHACTSFALIHTIKCRKFPVAMKIFASLSSLYKVGDLLCWFQTSLLLAALPLRFVIIACCFRVAALSGHAALALSLSGITPKCNRIQLSTICRGGQSSKVIDLLARRCLPLGHPSVASAACAVVQISSSKWQCGERQASLKAAFLALVCTAIFNVSAKHC